MIRPPREVEKRDGRREPFDPRRLCAAISRAAREAGAAEQLLAEELTALVALVLEREHAGELLTTDRIRQLVEQVLVETGHADVARAFIRHGKRRRRLEVARPAGRAGAVLVASAGAESRERFDRARIVTELVLEGGVAAGDAQAVAAGVERRLLALQFPAVNASLVRELLEHELRERGLCAALHSQQRIGVSRRRLDAWLLSRAAPPASELSGELQRRYSLRALYEPALADAHLAGDLQLDGLQCPRQALAAALDCGALPPPPVPLAPGPLLSLTRAARAVVAGPLFLVHVDRTLALAAAEPAEVEACAEQLLLALARSPDQPGTVLTLLAQLPAGTQATLFRRGHSPERVKERLRCVQRRWLTLLLRAGEELCLPRLRLLVADPDPEAIHEDLREPLDQASAAGMLERAQVRGEPASLRVLGARIGLNLARLAVRTGRRNEHRFLVRLRKLGQLGVAAGAQRLRLLRQLDEAGVGPLQRLRQAVSRRRHDLALDLPGDHGYHCTLVPVGLEAAMRAITEREPAESEVADRLRREALGILQDALPQEPGGGAHFALSEEPFPEAERRFGRLDFAAYPRGRDILGLEHDGGAFRYGRPATGMVLPRLLDPGLEPPAPATRKTTPS